MSQKPVSDLRRRMLEDMAVRRFSEKTKHDYIRHIETFTRFLGRSPDTATAEDLRHFQVHEMEQGAKAPKMNTQVSALRFFLKTTLGRLDLAHSLARVDYPRKLRRVLAPEDVARLLEAAPGPGLKYKAALSVAYGAGLRRSEVVALRVSDIDSKRMLIRVEVVPVHAFGMTQGSQGSTRDALPRSPTRPRSSHGSSLSMTPSGTSMPSHRSPDPKPCSPISPATRTAWRSPTAG